MSSFLSESEACEELLRRLPQVFPYIPAGTPRKKGASDGAWPAWVRYPVIGVFAIVVLDGVISAFTSGVDGAVLRIVVAAVLVPALLTPLVSWGKARRGSRRTAATHGSATRATAPRPQPSVPDLVAPIRAAGYEDYAARLEEAGASGATASEYLYEARHILQELLREQRGLPRDLEDQVHTLVRDLSSLF